MRFRRRFVEVDGVRTAFVQAGSGPPLLLLHGLGEFIEAWCLNITPLAADFAVWVPDLPGHGRSSWDDREYTPEYCRHFVRGFMDAAGIKRAGIIGRSLGGAIALDFARHEPGRVASLVLVSSGGYSDRIPLSYRLAMLPVLGELMLGPSVLATDSVVRVFMRRHFHVVDRLPPGYIHLMARYGRKPDRNAFIRHVIRSNAQLWSSRPRREISTSLADVQVPVLLVHGRHDHVVPLDQALSASRQTQRAKMVLFPDCGHNPQLEQPEMFNRVVRDFLLEHV